MPLYIIISLYATFKDNNNNMVWFCTHYMEVLLIFIFAVFRKHLLGDRNIAVSMLMFRIRDKLQTLFSHSFIFIHIILALPKRNIMFRL